MDAPRDWYHPYLEDHFICSDCQSVEKLLKRMYDNIVGHIEILNGDKDNLILKHHSQTKANNESFKEMARSFDNLTCALSKNIPDASNSEKINKSIKSLHEVIDTLFQSSSKNIVASPRQSDPLLKTLFHRINDISDELFATRSTLAVIVNAIQTPTSSHDELTETTINLTSLHAELSETITDLTLSPPLQSAANLPLLPLTDLPAAKLPADCITIEENEVEPLRTSPVAPRNIIKRFGTTWTLSE